MRCGEIAIVSRKVAKGTKGMPFKCHNGERQKLFQLKLIANICGQGQATAQTYTLTHMAYWQTIKNDTHI